MKNSDFNPGPSSTPIALQFGTIDNRKDFGIYLLERCGGINRKAPDFNTDAGNKYQPVIDGFTDDLIAWGNDFYSECYKITHDFRLSEEGKIEALKPIESKFNARFNDDLVKRCKTLQDIHFAKVEKSSSYRQKLPAVIRL